MSNTPTSSGFAVQPVALRGAAGCYEGEADALADAQQKLLQHLAGLSSPWGGDSVGQRFGAAYGPPADVVAKNVAAITFGFVRIAAALRAVANAYEAGDEALLMPKTAHETTGTTP